MSAASSPATPPRSHRAIRLFLGIVCFLAGAAIMVIEISAFRLLAPYFGNPVFTSTALIGVILVAFSVGGYLGGWLADRKMALDLIGWQLAGAAVLTLFIPAFHLAFSLRLSALGVISGPVMVSVILFAVPGILRSHLTGFRALLQPGGQGQPRRRVRGRDEALHQVIDVSYWCLVDALLY